jgi:hypothetical protein
MSLEDTALADLTRRVESNVDDCVRNLGDDHPRVDGYIDFNIPIHSGVIDSPDDLIEVKDWLQEPRRHQGSGVLLDNTTIVTLVSLLEGARLSPLTLWDLGRAVTALVTYDNVFHFKNPDVNDEELNTALGEVVFRPLHLPTPGPLYDPRGVRGLFNTAWTHTHDVMTLLERSIGTPTVEGLEIEALTKQWSLALGRALKPSDVVNAELSNHQWNSPGALLLGDLWQATRYSPGIRDLDNLAHRLESAERRSRELQAQMRERGMVPPEIEDRGADFLRKSIRESNYRGHVNERLAGHLGLPYMPNTARIPFRSRFYDLPRTVSDRLPSVLALDARYTERASQVQLLSNQPFVLPVFLALAVRDAATPADLWAAMAHLRMQAHGYRERRAALDKALEQGDLDITADTLKAVRTEAQKLTSLLSSAGGAAGESLLSSVEANPIAHLAGMPLDWLQTGLTALIAGVRKLLPESVTHRLMWRMCRPEYRFLSDVASESRAITTSMPAIQRLWAVPDNQIEFLQDRYDAFAKLQTSH